MSSSEMVKLIKDIGEIPAQRDTAYNIVKLY